MKQADPGRRTIWASFGALASIILASSCCLPLIPFLFAAGAAGTSAFFVKLRPFLLAASLGFIAWGFYQWRMARRCRRPTLVGAVLLWFSLIVVLAFLLFPQALANLLAGVAST